MKREIFSDKTRKKLSEKLLCDVSIHLSVTLFFSLSSVLTLISWNLQWNTSKHIEAYSDKGNIVRQKVERSFLRNCFVMCEFISENYIVHFIE